MINTLNIFFTGVGFTFSLGVALLFLRSRKGMLSTLVIALMTDIALCFVKDLFMPESLYQLSWMIDMTALPLYAGILYELCKPGHLHLKNIILAEMPFVLFTVLWCVWPIFYYMDLAFAVVFGVGMALWTIFAIPRYNRSLKSTFSYVEDIDLRWLLYLLWTFFIILSVWALSCIWKNRWLDFVYLWASILLWVFACRFIYKHKSVVDELRPRLNEISVQHTPKEMLFEKIRDLILNDKVYLNPMLKLSDIACMANTNRTYASEYFNHAGETFYDYINRLRVEYAKTLLADTDKKIDDIAADSGFNSRRSFHRAFVAYECKTPVEYRKNTTCF